MFFCVLSDITVAATQHKVIVNIVSQTHNSNKSNKTRPKQHGADRQVCSGHDTTQKEEGWQNLIKAHDEKFFGKIV